MSSLTDAIKERITIIDYMEHKGIPYKQKGKSYQVGEMDSLMIKPDKKYFTRYSSGVFGSVIDFVMEYNTASKDEAIKELRKMLGDEKMHVGQNNRSVTKDAMTKPPNKEFVLPERHDGKFSRMYAYLNQTRGISPGVITELVKRKMLYEDRKFHNAVWVGYDYDGKAKFGCKRVTIAEDMAQKFVIKNTPNMQRIASGIFINNSLTQLIIANVGINQKMLNDILKRLEISNITLLFDKSEKGVTKNNNIVSTIENVQYKGQIEFADFEKWKNDKENIKNYKSIEEPFVRGDIEGSNKEVGLFINNNSTSLLICEAPIDVMSLMTLLEHHKVNPEKYSYLAQSGVCLNALEYHIKKQPLINTVYLCYDNDEAGHTARGASRELLHTLGFIGKIIDKPPHNKDWNDDLRAINKTMKENIYEQTQLLTNKQEKERGLKKQWNLQR